jgi:hypothetical protein
MPKALTTKTFIERANLKHNNKYDYSKVVYTNNSTAVCIICPDHGEFWQKPIKHISNQHATGCPKCAGNMIMDTQTIILKARQVHENKYDYSKVEYKNCKEKVCITCPKHGDFWQTMNNHINHRQGCPICGGRVQLTTASFIKKARKVHGYRYNYSKVNYISSKGKITIICPLHGKFLQRASSHLSGIGCPTCKESKGEIAIRKWLTHHNINFVAQHTFIKCKAKKCLPFDFYLPDHNICIEFDGKQHFKEGVGIKFGKFQFTFNDWQELSHRDCIKNQYCLREGIWLLRISYKQFDNIPILLDTFFKRGTHE